MKMMKHDGKPQKTQGITVKMMEIHENAKKCKNHEQNGMMNGEASTMENIANS